MHVNASKPTTLKPTGLQLNKSNGGCAKPPRVVHTSYPARVVHTYSPRVYKIQPEEFLELVQKLTGKTKPTKPPRTFQFFETDVSKSNCRTENSSSRSQELAPATQSKEFPIAGEVLDTPTTRNLLGALPSPRLVTLNFLPLLSATPRARTN